MSLSRSLQNVIAPNPTTAMNATQSLLGGAGGGMALEQNVQEDLDARRKRLSSMFTEDFRGQQMAGGAKLTGVAGTLLGRM